MVWFRDESRRLKKCPKLQNLWLGPCVVLRKNSDLNYEIQLNAKGKRRTVHHNKLKPYVGDKPNWVKSLTKKLTGEQTSQ